MPLVNKIFRKIQPHLISKSDFLVVSFPKVGNTYTRLVIANVINQYYGNHEGINYHKLESMLPEIGKSNYFKKWNFNDFPKFIKTHDLYRPQFGNAKGILYIVRDPRDTLISYYHFTKAHHRYLDAPQDFDHFIRDVKYGMPSLNRHLDSYYKRIFSLFKYEDLMTTPEPLFLNLFSDLNILIDEQIVKNAIAWSNPKSMKKISANDGTPYESNFKKGFSFIRNANLNQWKEIFDDSQNEYIKNNAHTMFHELGYEF